MSENLTAADVLEEAADAFESGRLEWITGALALVHDDEVEPVGACLLGGLGLAAGYKAVELEAVGERVYASKKDPRVKTFLDARRAVATIVRELGDEEAGLWDDAIDPAGAALWVWNDLGDGLTKEGVIEVLKLAAKDLRNREE